jgi:hypothetical protein
VVATDLHPDVRSELRALSKFTAETVARRLVMTGELLDEDPEEALAHALAARRPASRIAVVREAVGLAAYRAGDWKLAISELRAYQRISGRQGHLALIADCERALGRPERAIDIYRAVDARQLDRDDLTELLIVAAGARRDLGQIEAALAMLQVPGLRSRSHESWVARLRYAYADLLAASGRTDAAREWLHRAVDVDPEGTTGAAERLLELDGVVLTDDSDTDESDGEESANGEGRVDGEVSANGEGRVDGEVHGEAETSDDEGHDEIEEPDLAERPDGGGEPDGGEGIVGGGEPDGGGKRDGGEGLDGGEGPGAVIGGSGHEPEKQPAQEARGPSEAGS